VTSQAVRQLRMTVPSPGPARGMALPDGVEDVNGVGPQPFIVDAAGDPFPEPMPMQTAPASLGVGQILAQAKERLLSLDAELDRLDALKAERKMLLAMVAAADREARSAPKDEP
jgi:hypothetical protein